MKKNKVEKTKIVDERKKEIFYCISIVLVLILLAVGDHIIMHFIGQVPNNNNQIFGANEEYSASDYTFDFLDELTMKEILTKINDQESFALLSSRDSCHTCVKYIPIVKELVQKYQIEMYAMNRSLYDASDEEFKQFTELDERLAKNLQYTPYIMVFKDGHLTAELIGSKTKEELENFIIDNQLAANAV